MTLRLTPEVLSSAYEFLKATKPFNKWKLPAADQVVFRVVRAIPCAPEVWAQHLSDRQTKNHPHKGHHLIDINERKVGHTLTLIQTMAHEMCHVRESMLVKYTGEAHGKTFWRLAREVCRHHGFDPKAF
jgi:hypothetical protein